jgi:kinesin family protein 11
MTVIEWLDLQVNSRLVGLRESGIKNKSFLVGHASSVGDIATSAKRKWQSFCIQAEKEAKDTADYSAAKHCRMEVLLQQRYVLLLLVVLV